MGIIYWDYGEENGIRSRVEGLGWFYNAATFFFAWIHLVLLPVFCLGKGKVLWKARRRLQKMRWNVFFKRCFRVCILSITGGSILAHARIFLKPP